MKNIFLLCSLFVSLFAFGAQRVQITGPGETINTGGNKVTFITPPGAVTASPSVTNIGDILSFTVRATGGGDDGIEYIDNASFTGDASGFGDYTPGPSSVLRNRIPSGQAMFSVDLYGTAWGNTGNGSSGAIQRIGDL